MRLEGIVSTGTWRWREPPEVGCTGLLVFFGGGLAVQNANRRAPGGRRRRHLNTARPRSQSKRANWSGTSEKIDPRPFAPPRFRFVPVGVARARHALPAADNRAVVLTTDTFARVSRLPVAQRKCRENKRFSREGQRIPNPLGCSEGRWNAVRYDADAPQSRQT